MYVFSFTFEAVRSLWANFSFRCSLSRNLQVCITPSYMVCHWFPLSEHTHCNWACFGQTNMENKCPTHHHSGTLHCVQFRRLTWMTTPTTTVGHHNCSVFLLSCSITLFMYLNGLTAWRVKFLGIPVCHLHGLSNATCLFEHYCRSPVFTSSILFCIFGLFGSHTNGSHNAHFKCSP